MKARFLIVLIVATALFTSCKNDKTEEDKAASTDTKFKVVLSATVKKSDNFQLFYSEGKIDEPFNEENSMWVDVKADSTKVQDIEFTLPDNVIPSYLRIDLGLNDKQKDIIINNFKMSYNGKSFEARGPLFFNYFFPNSSIEVVDKTTGLIKPIKMPNGTYDPLFYSEDGLLLEIKKIVK